jgi:hypothetical protein
LFPLPPKILCIASLRKLFLAAAGAKQDGQKSGFILFAFLNYVVAENIQQPRKFILTYGSNIDQSRNE